MGKKPYYKTRGRKKVYNSSVSSDDLIKEIDALTLDDIRLAESTLPEIYAVADNE